MKHSCIPFLIAGEIVAGLSAWMPAESAWAAACTSTKSGNWNDSTPLIFALLVPALTVTGVIHCFRRRSRAA